MEGKEAVPGKLEGEREAVPETLKY